MRRWLLRLLIIGGLAWVVVLIVRRRLVAAEPALQPVWPAFEDTDMMRPATPVAPVIPDEVPPSQRWHDPVDRTCPQGYAVKVKLASGIYHLPGMFAYERTIPDRCYTSPEAAEADGFRAAKR